MDPLDIVAFARSLVDIDSTTGREQEAGEWIVAALLARGYAVERQSVDGVRFNVLATVGRPTVVLSTHFDCVPPFTPSRVEGGVLWGRGSCDAKGILAAMVGACERLRAEGDTRVGLLFVVGEERGSDGARIANDRPAGARFLINGEPTDNRLASATRGILRVRLVAHGRAAHSSLPELGESAIEKLVTALVALREIELPHDEVMGRTHYTVGMIAGGLAPNVIPPAAEAEVMFRTVGAGDHVRQSLVSLERLVDIEHVLEVPPVRLDVVPGFETAAFAFTTDIPMLPSWGRPLLYGPGSVCVAHTPHEHVRIEELHEAVDGYVRLARQLMAQAG